MSDTASKTPTDAAASRPITEAADEVKREVDVRRRIYGRWVSEGKLSYMEAKARGERMESALMYLLTHPDMTPGYVPVVAEKVKVPPPF